MASGVDISYAQPSFNYDLLKQNGISFAMVRLGFGDSNIDKLAVKHIAELEKRGIDWGGYWFCYALNPDKALDEAHKCLSFIKNYRPKYPIAYDLEYDSVTYARKEGVVLNKDSVSQITKTFCNEMQSHNYYVSVYTNPDFIRNYLTNDVLTKYDLWLAQWGVKKPSYDCGMWQWGVSPLNGSNKGVDRDTAFYNFPEVITKKGLNIYK